MEETIIAPEEESKETPVAEVLQAPEAEKTIDEVLQVEEKKEPKLVPEAALIKIKQQNKELAREMKQLKALIEDGGESKEVRGSIDDIAEEHNIDKKFLKDFAKAIKAEADSDIDEKLSAKIKPLEEKDKAERFNTLFEKEYARTLTTNPEFEGVVNKDVIKTLTKDPSNGKKTLSQIMEDAYGNLVTGKRTLEKTTPRGGNTLETIDYDRAQKDVAYFNEIMANPESKKKYNAERISRLRL